MTKDEILKKRLDLNDQDIQNLYSELIKLHKDVTKLWLFGAIVSGLVAVVGFLSCIA